jgi:hypothetical protein
MCLADYYKVAIEVSLVVIVSVLVVSILASIIFPQKPEPSNVPD